MAVFLQVGFDILKHLIDLMELIAVYQKPFKVFFNPIEVLLEPSFLLFVKIESEVIWSFQVFFVSCFGVHL